MPNRRHVHTRNIRAEVYVRDDGLWDLEAELVDTKSRDFPLLTGIRKANDPIHHMRLTITIDTGYDVVAARGESLRVPYGASCQAIEPAYERLVGLNLLKNFRFEVRKRFGGTRGCTHMTELTNVLPTAAVQAFAGEVARRMPTVDADDQVEAMPWQLDRCHALRVDGPVVAEFHPRWYRSRPAPIDDEVPAHSIAEERS